MRFPEENECLIGKVCICTVGRVGVISGKETFDWGDAWIGIAFDGKGCFSSSNPVITAESVEEFRERLASRFNGKMSYHG